ncbi:retrovirus-related pol polyprotein from transposon TNT 1-94 [Tanacetum coccineum]
MVADTYKKTVASDSTITVPIVTYRIPIIKTSKAWKWWIAQQCPSAYKWFLKTKLKWGTKDRKETVPKRVSYAIDDMYLGLLMSFKIQRLGSNLSCIPRLLNFLQIVHTILFIVDSGCTKHMTGNLSLLCNFVEKYLGTVHFGNDQFAPILGYGDLVQGNITIKRVYYVEGLNHNLFSVGQFCDADLEVAFRKSTCFVRDLQGNDLLTGNRGTDLYTISLQETTSSTPICLMAKASPTQAWLWHRRLSHLNFDYINLLSKKDVVIGLPKLKYVKDQLCSSCEVSKAKRTDTTVPSQQELDLLFGPLYDEFFNDGTSRVNKSSSPTDNSAPQDTHPSTNIHPTSEPTTQTNVHAEENNDNQAEFTNPSVQPPVQTRRQLATDPEMCMFALTVSTAEPKNIKEAMADSAWIEAMQEELHQFSQTRQQNGYAHEKGIVHSKTHLHPFARMEAEEVYVAQPDGFVDPDHPDKVYRLKKALYGLKQAPRAWYDELSKFLISKGFTKDVDQAGFALDTCKSTSGGIQFLGDKLVSWMSKKQDCTAMSSAEAEYVALTASLCSVCGCDTAQDYGFNYNKIPLYCDSQSAIAISCNPVQHSRTKHIHIVVRMLVSTLGDLTCLEDVPTKSKDNDKGSRSKITKHEGTSLQRIQRPRPQDLNDKSNLIDLMKDVTMNSFGGEISKNLLDRVPQLYWPFSLPEHLKADNTVRVNWYHSDVLAKSQG